MSDDRVDRTADTPLWIRLMDIADEVGQSDELEISQQAQEIRRIAALVKEDEV